MIIPANDFIMNECTMKPVARMGVKTSTMHVYSPNGALIGNYQPIGGDFIPSHECLTRFSVSLLNKIGVSLNDL